jgi:hypothetical protein
LENTTKTYSNSSTKMPKVDKKKAFIFSTKGNIRRGNKAHNLLREKLESKGYRIINEFNCAGFDTFGLMKLIVGNKEGQNQR